MKYLDVFSPALLGFTSYSHQVLLNAVQAGWQRFELDGSFERDLGAGSVEVMM